MIKKAYRKWLARSWSQPLLIFTITALTALLICVAQELILPAWLTHGFYMYWMGWVIARVKPFTRWWHIRRYRNWRAKQNRPQTNPYRWEGPHKA